MEFLVTEAQLQKIIEQSGGKNQFSENLKRMKAFTNNMVNRVLKVYGINLKMLLTWGTSIAGLVMPLDNFIKSSNFDISESERYLVLCGVALVIFFEGKRGIVKTLNKIKDEGLEEIFDVTLLKGYQLKDSFVSFLESLKNISSQMLEITSYAFLIPIVTDIQNFAHGISTAQDAAIIIAERLFMSGLILTSREAIVELLLKIVKRLR